MLTVWTDPAVFAGQSCSGDFVLVKCSPEVKRMMLVDTLLCVFCGTRTYREATGKNARTVNVCCDKCQPSMFPKEVKK